MTAVPDRTEAAAYYFSYIDQVPEGDICGLLDAQGKETLDLLTGISEEQSRHRYAPGKWSIRDVVSHLSDVERLCVFRAFWFARGFESALPSLKLPTKSWKPSVTRYHTTCGRRCVISTASAGRYWRIVLNSLTRQERIISCACVRPDSGWRN